MERLFAKVGTISAYIFSFITWSNLTQFFAIVLTLVMIVYYVFKAWNEMIDNKEKRKKDTNAHSISK